jgi:hypothetical protein
MSDRIQVEKKAREGLEENAQFLIFHVKKAVYEIKRSSLGLICQALDVYRIDNQYVILNRVIYQDCCQNGNDYQ